ncbi:MAG: histidinol-phosphate transaminase [Bacillota bacterium]
MMMASKTWIRENILSIKPYVPGKPIEEVERELGIKDVIKMASNENPLGPSPEAVEVMREAVEKVYLYPDGNCFYLKQALASRNGMEEDNIIIGNGSDEILKLIAEAFLNTGEEAIIAHPSFSEYEFVTRLMGAVPVYVDLKEYRHDLLAMAEKISPLTKIIFVCNPNNPTGTIVTRDEIESFLSLVPDDVLVIFDEAYNEYVTHPRYPSSMEYVRQGRNNVIILRTFSKIYGLAGLRIGFGVATKETIAHLNRVREPFNVNSLAQLAAKAALEDQLHVDKSRSINSEGKTYLCREFRRMGLNYIPTEANFMMVNTGVDSRKLFQEMLLKGIIVRTGDIFGMSTFIRVTVGTPRQNERFIKTLAEVLAGMQV